MEAVKNSALMLLYASVMGLIYYFLLPSGKISQTAKSVLSVFMLLCVIQPLFSFMNMELPGINLQEYEKFEDIDGELISAAENTVTSLIDSVVKKYCDEPYSIDVSVNILSDKSINIKQVRIVFEKGFIPEEEMINELELILGAPPEISVREEE